MSQASKVVCDAILGMDFRTVIVAGKAYTIPPPTIRRIAGAARCLSDVPPEISTIKDALSALAASDGAAGALSWFITGDGSLTDELSAGTIGELAEALAAAYSLISVQDFTTLSVLAGNLTILTAKPKP